MNKNEWIQAEYRAATETNERETAQTRMYKTEIGFVLCF